MDTSREGWIFCRSLLCMVNAKVLVAVTSGQSISTLRIKAGFYLGWGGVGGKAVSSVV